MKSARAGQERLQEAMEQDQRAHRSRLEEEPQGWAEYVFGICRPDVRLGKLGSRRAG